MPPSGLLFQNPIISMDTKEPGSMEASPIKSSLFPLTRAFCITLLSVFSFGGGLPKEHDQIVCSLVS